MKNKIAEIMRKIADVMSGYPVVLLMAVIMASTIVFANSFELMRIVFTAALGISVMFAAKMLSQRVGNQWRWHAVGLLLLAMFYFVLPDNDKEFTEVYAFVIIPSFILSHLAVAFVAFTGKQSETSFWQYNKNLFVNLFLTSVFTGVLTGGVLLAIVATDKLFGLDIDGERYTEAFAVLSIVGSTFIFLLFSQKGLDYLEQDGKYPVVLKFFTQFILIPLLMIYVVILYFYSAKIVLKWELPQGWVSYLVLAYSVVGILALLLVHPLKNEQSRSWVRVFSRVFYISLLPLIVLLFTAIFTRVLEYGFTEARYYVLLLAIWLLSVVLYFILIKRPTIKFIPISLFVLGALSLILPYANTFSVAKTSQKKELQQLLSSNRLLKNGKIDFDSKISDSLAFNISDKFEFLSERDELKYLESLIDKKVAEKLSANKIWDVYGYFRDIAPTDHYNRSKDLNLHSNDAHYSVKGYDYALFGSDLYYDGVKVGADHFSLAKNMNGDTPEYTFRINDDKKDFLPLINALVDSYLAAEGEIDSSSLFVESTVGDYRIKIIFSTINRSVYKQKTLYDFTNEVFLIKKTK